MLAVAYYSEMFLHGLVKNNHGKSEIFLMCKIVKQHLDNPISIMISTTSPVGKAIKVLNIACYVYMSTKLKIPFGKWQLFVGQVSTLLLQHLKCNRNFKKPTLFKFYVGQCMRRKQGWALSLYHTA